MQALKHSSYGEGLPYLKMNVFLWNVWGGFALSQRLVHSVLFAT
jgi:hypothetical protein